MEFPQVPTRPLADYTLDKLDKIGVCWRPNWPPGMIPMSASG
ncbi:hypothetical protein AB0L05_41695 [Nonomuraea pusilla]